jgi:hypothetical protein
MVGLVAVLVGAVVMPPRVVESQLVSVEVGMRKPRLESMVDTVPLVVSVAAATVGLGEVTSAMLLVAGTPMGLGGTLRTNGPRDADAALDSALVLACAARRTSKV